MENIDLLSSFVNDALPFAWDDSESSMEFMGEVLVKTNEVVDAVNNCIEAFEETDASLTTKADKATTYTKTETDTSLTTKADKATTYTKTETDTLLTTKADKATTYTKTETDTSLTQKANKTQEAWTTPTLLNGWTSFAGTEPQYMKDQFGFVHFRGRINPVGKTSFSFAALPTGYRPLIMFFFNPTGTDNYLSVSNVSGDMQCYFTKWMSLEGVSYYAG